MWRGCASEFRCRKAALSAAQGPPQTIYDAPAAATSMRVAGSLVADIAFDSFLDDPGGPSTIRRITFVQRAMCIEAVVRLAGSELEIAIETTPPTSGTVRAVRGGPRVPLRTAEPTTLTTAPGLTSLLLESDAVDAPAVQTAWLVL